MLVVAARQPGPHAAGAARGLRGCIGRHVFLVVEHAGGVATDVGAGNARIDEGGHGAFRLLVGFEEGDDGLGGHDWFPFALIGEAQK